MTDWVSDWKLATATVQDIRQTQENFSDLVTEWMSDWVSEWLRDKQAYREPYLLKRELSKAIINRVYEALFAMDKKGFKYQ